MPATGPLTPVEFDFIWDAHSAGEVPYPLQAPSHGATMEERSALRKRTIEDLAQRGLVDGWGEPQRSLALAFDLLTGAEVSLDSVHIDDSDANAVLAFAGAAPSTAGAGKAVLAVQDARGLVLDELDPDGLASAIVGLFPRAQRGRERSITVPIEQLMGRPGADFLQRRPADEFATGNAPGNAPGSAGARDVSRAGADEERKALARLHAQPRLRGGQIGANSRSALGTTARSPVLSWFDTESGRYMSQASRGGDGREWITIAPADAPTLRQRIGEMLAGVRRNV